MEGDVAPCRVANVCRHGCGAVGRAHGARHDSCLAGPPRTFGGSPADVVHEVFQPVVGEREAVAVEGVGLYDVRPRVEVVAVHTLYDMRLCEAQHVVASLQRHGVFLEALAAEVLFRQVELLQISSRSAVEYQYALPHYVQYLASRHLFTIFDVQSYNKKFELTNLLVV